MNKVFCPKFFFNIQKSSHISVLEQVEEQLLNQSYIQNMDNASLIKENAVTNRKLGFESIPASYKKKANRKNVKRKNSMLTLGSPGAGVVLFVRALKPVNTGMRLLWTTCMLVQDSFVV